MDQMLIWTGMVVSGYVNMLSRLWADSSHPLSREMLVFHVTTLGAIFAGVVALVIWLGGRRDSRRSEDPNGAKCGLCGYPVRGLSAPRCPECGAPLAESTIAATATATPVRRRVWMMALVAIWLTLALPGYRLVRLGLWPDAIILKARHSATIDDPSWYLPLATVSVGHEGGWLGGRQSEMHLGQPDFFVRGSSAIFGGDDASQTAVLSWPFSPAELAAWMEAHTKPGQPAPGKIDDLYAALTALQSQCQAHARQAAAGTPVRTYLRGHDETDRSEGVAQSQWTIKTGPSRIMLCPSYRMVPGWLAVVYAVVWLGSLVEVLQRAARWQPCRSVSLQ